MPPEELRRNDAIAAVRRGFVLGSHSYSHVRFSNLRMSKIRLEISKTESLLDEIYKEASVNRFVRLFHFPFGDKGWDRPLPLVGSKNRLAAAVVRRIRRQFVINNCRAIQRVLRRFRFSQPIYENPLVDIYTESNLDRDVPKGSRTPVTAVKGRCPRPLDDGDVEA